MEDRQAERTRQLVEMIGRSRQELGKAALFAAGKHAITVDEAKALNLHLGVTDYGLVLANSKRRRKDFYLQNIAEAIRFRRHHLESHRIIRVKERLTETSVLAAAVGESTDSPAARSELVRLDIVKSLSRHHGVDPNVVVDQTVSRDLRWLWAPTDDR